MANEIEFSFLEPSDLMTKTTYDADNNNVVDVAKDIEGFDTASDDTFYGKVGGVTGFHNVPAGSQTLAGLTDVNTSGITSGQVLQYDGDNFVAATVSGGAGASTLDELTDVIVGTPSSGNVLKYDSSGWVSGSIDYSEVSGVPTLTTVATSGSYEDLTNKPTIPSAITSLTELSDVNISDITTGQILNWDGTQFIPVDMPSAGGTTPTQLGELTNVDTTSQSSNDVLKFNGTTWLPASVSYNDLTDQPSVPESINDLNNVDIVTVVPSNGDSLVFDGTNFVPQAVSGGSGATQLDELSDVTISTLVDNQFLRYNGTNWVNGTVDYSEVTGKPSFKAVATSGSYNDLSDQPPIPSSVDDLSDVNASEITSGQVLQYDGSNFVPATITGGGAESIDDLTDVDTTGAAINNVLKYDGSSWVDGSVAYSEVTGTPTLSTVATSGSYNDLSDSPVLSTVATSGSYTDLSNTPSIPSTIDDLFDTSDITSGQVLQFDGSNFVAATITSGGGAGSLDDLTDVDTSTTAPSTGDTLVYNGAEWVPQAPSAGGGGSGPMIERFRIQFSTDNRIAGTVGLSDAYSEITSGITPVLKTDSSSNNVITTINFTGYRYPPANIMFYGYAARLEKFIISPLNVSITAESFSTSGDATNPDVFGNFQSMDLLTTATNMGVTHKTGFGATSGWGYVVFVMQG